MNIEVGAFDFVVYFSDTNNYETIFEFLMQTMKYTWQLRRRCVNFKF